MPPCRRQVGASLRRLQRSQEVHASFSESSDCAKSHSGGFWGAVHPLAQDVNGVCACFSLSEPQHKEFYNENSLARHWARDWRALALTQQTRSRRAAGSVHSVFSLAISSFCRSMKAVNVL